MAVDKKAPSKTFHGWKGTGEHSHFVQFFSDDAELVDSVGGFIGGGLLAGYACVVIATPEHRSALEQQLGHAGFDLHAAREWTQYVALDAVDTLAGFMLDGWPDADRFEATVGAVIATATHHQGVLAFGEMVSLLWQDGQQEATIELERLWNVLAQRHRFSLYCGYSASNFEGEAHSGALAAVCAQHPGGVVHAGGASRDRIAPDK